MYYPANGMWYIHYLNRAPIAITNHGGPYLMPVPGDYDGDGIDDLALYDRETGNWHIRTLDGRVLVNGMNWGWSEATPVPGDFDGDGRADLAVYHRARGDWYILSLNGRILAFGANWGWPGAVPVPGDFDGDGCSDLAVYHRARGDWYIRALDGRILTFGANWGWSKAWPVTGDFDGDGCSDLAVYHRAAGLWYIRALSGQVIAWATNWGGPTGVPVPGDYNGDGRTDLAYYNRATGDWSARTLEGDVLLSKFNWGFNGAVPAALYASPASDGLTLYAFGDSITWGGGSSTDGPATGYPFRLERQLEALFGGYFRVINAGRPGETTWAGRSRLAASLPGMEADVLLLMEGVNDALYDHMFVATEYSLRMMLQTARSHGLSSVLATHTPVISNRYFTRDEQMGRILAFRPAVFRVARDFGVPVADVFEAVVSVPGWRSLLIHQQSANHPNDLGYTVLRDCFYNALAPRMQAGDMY